MIMRCACVLLVLCVAVSSAVDDMPWWRTANLYQVYPRSFKDTTGRGVGDLKGITQNAQHFKDIGLDAIWMNPIFESPMLDNGYDISNFTAIDPLFGTMDDFDALVKRLKELGIKLLLDFVPNHTSDKHEWFKQSLNTSNSDYLDFYVWKEPKGRNPDGSPIPPNNWLSLFGGSIWEWREERQMFYLHQFYKQQPDLNYRNPKVIGNITEVLSFWLDKGVDGFRMDATRYIYENGSFPDAPILYGNGSRYLELSHVYDTDQPETLELVKFWAELVENRTKEDGQERVVFPEVYDTHANIMPYYNLTNNSMVIPFNFDFVRFGNPGSQAPLFKQVIESWMTQMPAGGVPNWVVGNHDNRRIPNHFGTEMVDSINLLTGVLPGIKASYNGEEIGMADTFIRPDQIVDDSGFGRDPHRTPMQWDSSPSAGFSTNLTTWLPVNPNYWWLNVAAQKAADTSHLKVFQAMSKARKDPVLQRGDLNLLVPNNDTLVVVRQYNGSYFALLINMGSTEMSYTSQNLFQPNSLDINMTVVTSSINCDLKAGATVRQGAINLTLRSKAAVLLRSVDNVPSSSLATRPLLLAYVVATAIAFLSR